MKKFTVCLFFTFALVGCSDENKVPEKNTRGTVLNQSMMDELKASLLKQITNDNVADVILSKKEITQDRKDALVQAHFILDHGEDVQETLPISFQNGEWNIRCSVPICHYSASPSSVTREFIDAIENNNTDLLISTLYVPQPYLKKRLQRQLTTTLPQLQKPLLTHGGVDHIEFSTIVLNKEGTQAVVPFELIYKDDQVDKFKYTAVKKDEKWFIQCEFKSCLIYSSAENVVEELIYAIVNADPEQFVNVLNVTPSERTRLYEYYKIKLTDLKSQISKKDGVKKIVIDSVTRIDNTHSKVVATIIYNDGSEEQQSYTTQYAHGRWFVQL